ncbi:DUF5615 family PIN-like protein [Hymenobacter aerophilus]|uniref:DUF5615 family PIN-like protein n=1 Tax=Hymenobacter aerophilus TaxID=119644 RepID=UPI0003754248|nr:DUF5615 family PIN-like protein [Hymenobacter aerophilus]
MVDAGVGASVEQLLRNLAHFVVAIRDIDTHLPDTEVLALAHRHEAIVVTMDKDFGELVFRGATLHHGVLLLRLEEATGPERANIVRLILEQHGAELPGRFSVFQHDRLRISGSQ